MNKKSTIYLLIMFVLLVAVFMFQYFTPKKFVWSPTFSKYDKEPFGSYVFDDVLSTSISDYSVINQTFYQLYKDVSIEELDLLTENEWEDTDEETMNIIEFETDDYSEQTDNYPEPEPRIAPLSLADRKAFLITENHLSFTDVDITALIGLLKQGNKVMLCLNSFPEALLDTLNLSEKHDYYDSFKYLEEYAKKGNQRDSIYLGDRFAYPEQIYAVYPQMHPSYFKPGRSDDDKHENSKRSDNNRINCDSSSILVHNKDGKPLAMRLHIGAGELFLVSTPLLFTNYSMLDGTNASYVFRLLSYMKELPLARIESYGVNSQSSRSPLRYILSQPTLQWALFVTLVSIILFMIFTAKRKQRVIPIVTAPKNEALRFTQLIGNLYFQKKDYKDILRKKYLYFCSDIKRHFGLDLQSHDSDEEQNLLLANKMGQDPKELWPLFRELKYLLRDDTLVEESAMIRFIESMNTWKKRLS